MSERKAIFTKKPDNIPSQDYWELVRGLHSDLQTRQERRDEALFDPFRDAVTGRKLSRSEKTVIRALKNNLGIDTPHHFCRLTSTAFRAILTGSAEQIRVAKKLQQRILNLS